MDEVASILHEALGLGSESRDLGALEVGLRAVVVYVVTVAIVRVGKRRFMGRATAFDVILGIMLGSIVSRAVTGNAPFLPALVAAAVLMAMHWLFSWIALHWSGFGWAVKGRAVTLVHDGSVERKRMRETHITEHDLWEDLRGKGISDLKQIAEARLERSGQLSVIEAGREPRIVEITIANGVQTVRVEMTG